MSKLCRCRFERASNAIAAIAVMDTKTRVDLARVKIKNVVDRISALLLISEQNALIVYSPLLAGRLSLGKAIT